MNSLLLFQPLYLLSLLLLAPAEEADLRKAAIRLNSVIGSAAQENKLEELLKDPTGARKLLAAARKLHEEKDSPLAYSANFILGNVALELREVEHGEAFLSRAVQQAELLRSDEKLVYAYLNWIDLNLQAKRYDAAEQITKKLLEREPDSDDEPGQPPSRWYLIGQVFGLRKLVQINALRGDIDAALKTLEDEKYDQRNPFILETRAWVYSYAGKYPNAIEIYEDLVKQSADRESMADTHERHSRMLSSLYGDAGQIDKAAAVLLPLLKKNPDDDGLNNDLGYLWADHDQKLEEAEAMIRKAVASKPTNASYLDSLAWVLYRQKKYQEAKTEILKAVASPRGVSMEILEHQGDIHAALNEKAEAKAAWMKAIAEATGSARDQKRVKEIEKKLKELNGG